MRWMPYIFLMPTALLLLAVVAYPIGHAGWMSFHQLDLLRPSPQPKYVGFENYRDMLSRPDFWQAAARTVLYTAGVSIAAFLLGLAVALLLNERFPFRRLFRAALMLPWAVPLVVSALTWKVMLDPQTGVVNALLRWVGLITRGPEWLQSADWALPAVILIDVWKDFPLATLFLLGGLQAIPIELYEAAKTDGANGWQRFRHVTWPGLLGVATILFLLQAVWIFRRFTTIYALTAGGPAKATETLVIQTYNEAFRNYELSYASTLGVLTLLVTLAFAAVYIHLLRRKGEGL
jgi:multiple sugar transport system permease protein